MLIAVAWFGCAGHMWIAPNCVLRRSATEKLSEGGEQQRCGWLKDKYGVSWQIIPPILGELLQSKDAEKSKRVMNAMLRMQKLDIEGLKNA